MLGEHKSHSPRKFVPWDGKSKITYTDNKAFVYLTGDVSRSETFNVPGNYERQIYKKSNGVRQKWLLLHLYRKWIKYAKKMVKNGLKRCNICGYTALLSYCPLWYRPNAVASFFIQNKSQDKTYQAQPYCTQFSPLPVQRKVPCCWYALHTKA